MLNGGAEPVVGHQASVRLSIAIRRRRGLPPSAADAPISVFFCWILRLCRAEPFPLKLPATPKQRRPGNPVKNSRASSGEMPVGATFRTVFIPAKHGAVQSCGGVRCKCGKRATGCIAAGAAACRSASAAGAIAAIFIVSATAPRCPGARRTDVPAPGTSARAVEPGGMPLGNRRGASVNSRK